MDRAGETIFALSTPPGRSGIAVIRISGPAAGAALEALGVRPRPPARLAQLRALADPDDGAPIDRGIVLWFPGPASFTGDDMAELHLHGGRAVVAAAVDALARRPGLRPAEAGEFTRRAFDAGKLDLAEVEGLADLIDAETEAQRRQALRQMAGQLSALIEDWRARVVRALAHLEAAIDFGDEEALPEDLQAGVGDELGALAEEIAAHLADRHRGERLRAGLQVAILGPPNSGKSSLLNALARRDVAIVSETAGTTRDVIEVHLDLDGYPLTVADTAGLRALEGAGDGVEQEGMRRARRRAEDADLKIAVFDATTWPELDRETLALIDENTLVVLNKVDLDPGFVDRAAALAVTGRPPLALSAKTGWRLTYLLEALARRGAESLGSAGAAPAITRARHRQALEDCRAALARARAAEQPELAAEDLRLASRALGRITGRIDVEDILDVIFRDFCIGK